MDVNHGLDLVVPGAFRKLSYDRSMYSAFAVCCMAYYTVFQKSDAKIQITITTANLIRINYPFSSFNYRPSGTNLANFNKIHRTVSEQQLFK